MICRCGRARGLAPKHLVGDKLLPQCQVPVFSASYPVFSGGLLDRRK